MLTYAGVTLPLPSQETYLWVLRSLSPADAPDFQRRSWPGRNLTGMAWPGQTPPRLPKLNTLYWPTGASRWAVFYGLANDADVQALRTACLTGSQVKAQPLVLSQRNPDGTAAQAGGSDATVTAQMYLLPPRPLMQCPGQVTGPIGAPDSPYGDRLWLLTLVDERYLWWQKALGNLSVTENTTAWTDLFTSLGRALGTTLNVDAINAAYLKPAAAWAKSAEAIPPMLDAACYNVGMRFVRGLDGFARVQSADTSLNTVIDALAQTDRLKVWAGGVMPLLNPQTVNDLAFLVPGTVRVSFCADPATTPYSYDVALTSLSLAQFNNVGGNATLTKGFKDVALASDPSNPTNAAELQALAKQLAKDWYKYQLAAMDVKLDGIDPWVPDGLCDAIEWTYLPWEVSTRIYRPAFNDQTEELQHASSLGSCVTKATVTSKTAAVLVEFDDYLLCAPFSFVDGTQRFYDPDVAGTIEVSTASWTALGGIVTFSLASPHGLSTGANSAAVGAAGTGYLNGDILTATGGTFTSPATFKVLAANIPGNVITVQVQNSGSYTVTPPNPVTMTGGSGTGCTLTIAYGLAAISATVAAGGTGYTNSDNLTLVGGDFTTAATFVATVVAGVVTAVALNSGGIYTRQAINPASVSGGTGTGCKLNVTYSGASKFKIIEAVPDTYNGTYTPLLLPDTMTVKALMASDPGTYQFNADFVNLANCLYVAKPPILQVTPWDGKLVLFPNGDYHFYEYQWRVEDAAVQAGGTSYVVDDFLTAVGGTLAGTNGIAARFRVTGQTSGVVTSVELATPGVYDTTPTNPVSTTTDSVSGSGCTLRLFRSRQRTNTIVVPQLDGSGNFIIDGSDNFVFTSKQAPLTEIIDPAYFTGDVILLDGGPTGLTDENNAVISWTDANNGGRHWEPQRDEPILAILTDKDLTQPGFRRYAWTQVVDADTASPPTSAIGASVANGGFGGYHVGDTLTLVGGVFSTATTFLVLAVDSGGKVLIVNLGTPGSYTAPPTNPVTTTGGSGSGCTLNVTFGGQPITYTTGDLSGTFNSNPAYNLNDVDIAVPFFAWLHKSKNGNYYLFEGVAQWEVCIQTGATAATIGGIGYFPGKMGVYDQNAKQYIDGQDIWLLDANA